MIYANALGISIAEADLKEIEKYNILGASLLAMKRAVDGLMLKPDIILIDGPYVPDKSDTRMQAIPKGDATHTPISAASIIAKVYRDRLMEEIHKHDDRYFFNQHKGYPTKLHYQQLKLFGHSRYHRIGFRLN